VAVLLNAPMGLPPVVIGLFVYLMLSRSSPFGVLGVPVMPIAAALPRKPSATHAATHACGFSLFIVFLQHAKNRVGERAGGHADWSPQA